MKKTIVANWGSSEQGKSATIKELSKLIVNAYSHCLIEDLITARYVTLYELDFTNDIQIIIEIGSLKIGIESQGDPNSRIFESLKIFTGQNPDRERQCDIIICSTRTSKKTVKAVSALSSVPFEYEIIWVTNYRSYEKDKNRLNYQTARHQLGLVKEIIHGNL